jgi:hypothetical protein
MLVNRRFVIFAATAALAFAGLASSALAGPKGLTWGVNGHPLTSYPGVPLETQLEHIRELGLTSYRVDIASTERLLDLQHLVREAKARGITVLPVITPSFEMDRESAEVLEKKAYGLAFALVSSFKGEIPVWELGNELESYAIIQPCEMQDDGKPYSCSYGPAGGVSVNEYFGPRWAKVSAVLKGLTRGARAADPNVKRAVGTAGWGHLGAFARMKADGIEWDISVWHMYGQNPEWAFKELVKYQRPIWVTEFNNPGGSKDGKEAQATGLRRQMALLQDLQASYDIEAAHIYELMDEPYWEGHEAYMGLVEMKKDEEGRWSTGSRKPAFEAVKSIAEDSKAQVQSAAATPNQCASETESAGGSFNTRGIITYAYCFIVGRQPDIGGLEGWESHLKAGMRIEDALVEMLRSDEFSKLNAVPSLTSAEYVKLVHRVLLGRNPSELEVARSVSAFEAGGTRAELQRDLIHSNEFHTRHQILFGDPASVVRRKAASLVRAPNPELRRTCDLNVLRRPLEFERGQVIYSYCLILGRWPDGHGLETWRVSLRGDMTLENFLMGLITSNEFAGKYQTETLEQNVLVTLVYRLLLGRDPRAAELAARVKQFADGSLSRIDFYRRVLNLEEFHRVHQALFSPLTPEKARAELKSIHR